jgi:DNA invertase Pin-like site-specific DNA recombinase
MPRGRHHTAYYLRVSTNAQTDDSQRGDMERHSAISDHEGEWYTDTFTGRSMDRPEFNRMMELVRMGKVKRIVVWRLDRLGRTAAGLCKLFEELQDLGCALISIRDNFDLTTPSGRLLACILASVAAYEREVLVERIKAGQQAAKAKGKRIGGSQKGRFQPIQRKNDDAVKALHEAGYGPTKIGKTLGLSKPCVYASLKRITGLSSDERRAASLRERSALRGIASVNGSPVAPPDEEE